MATHLPTIKQLQYLVALREHGHFGKAAESCFVTQSTLSAGLRELETLLGVILVERTRRVVRFTALGEKIADKAIKVLREAEELSAIAQAEGQPLHGELRLGVIPTIAPFLLPAMLPRLRREWPSLRLYLREETSQAACEALHRGQLDCVLLALPFNCGDVDSAMLFDDPLFVAFPRGEAPDGSDVDVSTIDENRMLLLEDGHCLKDHALEAGILSGTGVDARALRSDHGFRRIALIWRRSSPRENEFQLLASALQRIMVELNPDLAAAGRADLVGCE